MDFSSIYLPFRNLDSAHYIDVYKSHGGYSKLSIGMQGEEILNSNFITRYGKNLSDYWNRFVLPPTKSRALLTNLAVFEPGMFQRRKMILRDPHGLIEGMLLAARSSGADQGYIISPIDDPEIYETIDRVLEETYQDKLWGEHADWSFTLRNIRLPSSAMFEQDSFLLASLHGERPGYPNRKEFLYGLPVHLHRPEEFYAFRWIEYNGAEKFNQLGSKTTPGSYFITVGGSVPKPVVVEVPGGSTIENILEQTGLSPAINGGWFRWGGVLGQWTPWHKVKKLSFELSHGPFKLHDFQYPLMEWFSEEGAAAAKRAMAYYVGDQSCGACLGCSHATSGLVHWNKQELIGLKEVAKCSFFKLAINASIGPSW